MSDLNQYQIQAASEALAALDRTPLAAKVTIEVRGIVGGDFDVVATKGKGSAHGRRPDEVKVVSR